MSIEEVLNRIVILEWDGNPYVPTGCWEWNGSKSKYGYPKAWIRVEGRRKSVKVHRLVYEVLREPILSGLFLCHHCDNPGCVNPDHGFVGTVLDNNRDAVRKGRNAAGDRNGSRTCPGSRPRGEAHWNRKLTEEQVLEIKHLYGQEPRPRQVDLARKFQTTQTHISRLIRGESWNHVVE